MKNSTRIIGVLLTLFVHLLIILSILIHITSIPPPPVMVPDEPKRVKVTLIQPPSPISEKKKANDQTEKISYPLDERICGNKDSMYFGVGIIVSFGSNTVTYAPEYYPAYKAGMRVGDFLNDPDAKIKDGWVDFDVLRHMTRLHFHIKTDNICFGKG